MKGGESDSASTLSVGAVIVTFRRPEVLMRTLLAVLAQSHPVEMVVVVDNDADDDVKNRVADIGDERLAYVPMPENEGFGAGLATGMESLTRSAVGWMWLLDDDSPPAFDAVAGALEFAAPPVGAIATRGGFIKLGLIRHRLGGAFGASGEAHFTLLDGALISTAAVRRVGLPRTDLFMMMEDVEYTTRLRCAGYRLYVRPRDASEFLYLGARSSWRAYYQARNHLRIALDLHKWSWLFGWLYREVASALHAIRRRDLEAIRLRSRGSLDALRNRMGRTVEPSDYGHTGRAPRTSNSRAASDEPELWHKR